MKKILLVLTNVSETQRNKLATGFHFAEFTHAYEFFKCHGYEVTVASPNGGKCTISSDHPGDKINAIFKQDPARMKVINETIALARLKDRSFDAVYVAGGHGAMFDLPNNPDLTAIIKSTYQKGGVIASVCHGPAALVGVRLLSGDFLVNGKHVTSFTNDEEKATPLFEDMPFLLQTKLTEQGVMYEKSGEREPHLAIDSRVITGQNPESIELVIGAVHALLTE